MMMQKVLLLCFPFLVWLAIHYRIFTGQLSFSWDNTQYFYWTAYHITSMLRGVYPLWNPFHAWGSVDNFDMRFMGEFNPLYAWMGLLNVLGCPLYWAFIIGVLIYFWLACLGVFALSNRLVKDQSLAWLAYVLVMFSCLTEAVFREFVILVIIVPAIWFFVFLWDFFKSSQLKDQLRYSYGIIFMLMIIASSYIPFFFIVILSALIISILLIYPKKLLDGVFTFLRFIKVYPLIIIVYILLLSLACVPSWLWLQESKAGNYALYIERNEQANSNATVDLKSINEGGLATQTSFEELFANFDVGHNVTIYVPIMIFMLVLLSLINSMVQRHLVLLMMAFILFLISLANITPIHSFLYHHIVIFKLFRNLFFFWPVILMLLILVQIGQLQIFLSRLEDPRKKRWLLIVFIVVTHLVLSAFLMSIENVPITSLISIVLSALWFLLRALNIKMVTRSAFIFVIGCIAMVQPSQVLSGFHHLYGQSPLTYKQDLPVFSYMRPVFGQGFNEAHGFHNRLKIYQDESGFFKTGYFGTRFSYDLHSSIEQETLQNYVKYKFIVYDQVAFMDFNDRDTQRLKDHLSNLVNEVLIDDPKGIRSSIVTSKQAQVITGSSNELRVEEFDLNYIRIRTHFSSPKFLVYNDSYHVQWRGLLDGQPMSIYRANMAFKGFWVEAGEHIIELQFGAPLRQMFFVFLQILFVVIGLGFFILIRKRT